MRSCVLPQTRIHDLVDLEKTLAHPNSRKLGNGDKVRLGFHKLPECAEPSRWEDWRAPREQALQNQKYAMADSGTRA